MAQSSGAEQGGGAPAWLFSFVDLAFLMLIAMTIVANQNAGAPDLGEMIVPKINEESTKELSASRGDVWQLRVHPPIELMNGELEPPFELIVIGGNQATPGIVHEAPEDVSSEDRIGRDELRQRLAKLEADIGVRPLLAPHEDSRSQDLLDAASLIEEHWPNKRRAVIDKRIDG